jgi:gamma-F420-2:alpha-L-glutamate ligase
MLGWIIYKDSGNLLRPEAYEINRLVEAAAKYNIEIIVYKPEQFEIVVTREDRKSVLVDNVPTPLPDFLIPRMGSSTTYFAFAVIRHLERLGVYSFNDSASIDAVKDKLYHLQILAESGLPIPKTMLAKWPVDHEQIRKQLGFPAVIKSLSGTQGSGVFLSKDKDDFMNLMRLIQTTNPRANFIIQEYIKSSHGKDLRVLTVGGRIIGAMQRESTDGDFRANFSRGGEVKRFEVTPQIEWLVLEISRILKLDIAGVDLLFDNDGFKICEVNSSPGFQGMEKAMEKDIADEIIQFIKLRLGFISKKN